MQEAYHGFRLTAMVHTNNRQRTGGRGGSGSVYDSPPGGSMRMRGGSSLSLLTVGVWLAAMSCDGGTGSVLKAGGSAGSDSGTAGSGATGSAGSTAAGAAGSEGSGAAGATTTGTGGDGTAGASTTGTGGSGAGGSGTAGSTGTGGSGTAGTGTTPPADGGTPMGTTGMSDGCTKPAAEGT